MMLVSRIIRKLPPEKVSSKIVIGDPCYADDRLRFISENHKDEADIYLVAEKFKYDSVRGERESFCIFILFLKGLEIDTYFADRKPAEEENVQDLFCDTAQFVIQCDNAQDTVETGCDGIYGYVEKGMFGMKIGLIFEKDWKTRSGKSISTPEEIINFLEGLLISQ